MRHYKLISIAFGFFLFFGIVLTLHTLNRDFQPKVTFTQDIELLPTSAESSYQIINEIFNDKARSYEDDGFFPQLYASSLQTTYYGLFILNTLGKLEVANESKIISFIMSHYNSSSGVFMDDFSSRYLGTDFSYTYENISRNSRKNSIKSTRIENFFFSSFF